MIRRLEKEVDSSKSLAEVAAAVFQASLSELENKVEVADRACDRAAADSQEMENWAQECRGISERLREEMDVARDVVRSAEAENSRLLANP